MDGRWPNLATLSDTYPSHRPAICTGVDRRAAGPSPYKGLPPHMQPLPDSNEGEADVDVCNTVPLGSRSTQEWTGSQLYDRRGAKYRQSFTSLLHEGAQDEERLPPVDLTFGLRRGNPSSATHTVLVNPHPNDDAGQVALVGRGTRGGSAPQETSEKTRERPRVQATCGPSIPRTTGGRHEWMNPPPAFSRGRDTVPRPVERGVSEEDFPFEGAHGDGRWAWKESRQELWRQQEESIPQGVQRLRVGEQAGQADVVGGGGDVWTNGDEVQCDVEEDDSGDVFPLCAPNMGDRGGRGRASTNAGRRRKRSSATSADAEGEEPHYQPEQCCRHRWRRRCATPICTVGDSGICGGRGCRWRWQRRRRQLNAWGLTDDWKSGRFREEEKRAAAEALSECMEKHGALMASTMESASRRQCEAMESASKRQCSIQIRQCEAIEAEVEVQKQHWAASNEVSKLMPVYHALLEIAKAIRERRVVVVSSSSPSSLSVFSAMTNTRNSSKGKRERDSQKTEAAGVVKRGRHQAKKPKASSGGALVIGRFAREEWVTEASSGQDDDFESEADTFHGRKGTLRELSNSRMVSGEEGVDGGKDGGHGVAQGKGEAGGDVGGGVAAREERGQPMTPGMCGAVPSKDVQAVEDVGKHPPMRAPSNPATPTAGQARRDEGAGVNAAVRGQLATRIPAKEAAAVGAVVGTSTTGAGGGGGDDRDDADDDDPLINRQRRSENLAALEAKVKLWVNDLRFWNEMEGHGMFKIIQETRLHLIALAKGGDRAQPPAGAADDDDDVDDDDIDDDDDNGDDDHDGDDNDDDDDDVHDDDDDRDDNDRDDDGDGDDGDDEDDDDDDDEDDDDNVHDEDDNDDDEGGDGDDDNGGDDDDVVDDDGDRSWHGV
ncbi:hypothetical protein CBR_g24124 [Chara braunii]|uniref:Uncharacterized protein n=1 Tax=Chara braunii TaxID=69332 RepID=A0A388L5X9_CHABU|nr:hypothetical protein CBR_g24124 [Chara braunii]|eukprot:GBG77678.1 hypothetical protein CBR_g24124 [Chara braunii]